MVSSTKFNEEVLSCNEDFYQFIKAIDRLVSDNRDYDVLLDPSDDIILIERRELRLDESPYYLGLETKCIQNTLDGAIILRE